MIPWIINSYLKSFTLLILDHPLFDGFELSIVSGCVINNGFGKNYFSIDCGVRHGDLLSPLLFILILEVSSIRQNDKIQGIKIKNEEVKLCEWFPHEFKLSIQILGVYFDYDELLRKKANFEGILKSTIRTFMYVEMERAYTLIGKIQIVKSFAIPKFMSKASLIHVSNVLIQAANKEFFNFIWKGKDKIKRLALIHEYGGLKIYDSCTKNHVFEKVY